MVLLGRKTVRAGERAAIWSTNGTCKIVDGPARVMLVNQKMTMCRNYFASESQYLEVRKKAGPVQIIHGPCSLFQDPIHDDSIAVRNATMVDASEALVVYQHTDNDAERPIAELKGASAVQRRVVRGPARFIPAANEWVHEFAWSGVPRDGSKTTYQPKALKFSLLKTIPMTAYHNVNEVRTNDDTLLTVKLMLFFELVDVEKMLDSTPDPIGDFINAASSDTIAFCAGVTTRPS